MLFATTNFTHRAKFWNMGTWIPLNINDQVMIKKLTHPPKLRFIKIEKWPQHNPYMTRKVPKYGTKNLIIICTINLQQQI